jgi:hypothetical protein
MTFIPVHQTVSGFIPNLIPPAPKTYAAWPVWHDSTTRQVKFFPQPKKHVLKYWRQLQKWNAQTKQRGCHGGGIGLTAMTVFECLIFTFQNWKTGRLDPSYDALQKATGLCRQAIADALAKLKALGVLNWLRRCTEDTDETGAFRLRQLTNAYAILPPSQWHGYDDPPTAPPPDPDAWGACPPLPSALDQYSADVKAGVGKGEALAYLAADADSDLERALARYGRAVDGAGA